MKKELYAIQEKKATDKQGKCYLVDPVCFRGITDEHHFTLWNSAIYFFTTRKEAREYMKEQDLDEKCRVVRIV